MSDVTTKEIQAQLEKAISLYGALLEEKTEMAQAISESKELVERIEQTAQKITRLSDTAMERLDALIVRRIERMSNEMSSWEEKLGKKMTEITSAEIGNKLHHVDRASQDAIMALKTVKRFELKHWFFAGAVMLVLNLIISFSVVEMMKPDQASNYTASAQDMVIADN